MPKPPFDCRECPQFDSCEHLCEKASDYIGGPWLEPTERFGNRDIPWKEMDWQGAEEQELMTSDLYQGSFASFEEVVRPDRYIKSMPKGRIR